MTPDQPIGNDGKRASPRVAWRIWMPPALVAALGAALALAFSLVIYPAIREPLAANVDPDRLGDLSSNLASGEGFVYTAGGNLAPEFDRGPVYPAVVAGIILLGRTRSFIPVQVFQSVLHGVTCFLVFLIAARLHPRRIALRAESLCAVHPMLLWYTARIWIETTHTFLVTASLLSLMVLAARPAPGRALKGGVMLGITALTKSVLLPFSWVAAALMVFRKKRDAFPSAATLVIACLLVVLPWTVRNFVESGYFIPVQTGIGINRVQGDVIGMNWSRMPFSSLGLWLAGRERIDSLLAGTGTTYLEPAGDRVLTASSLRMNIRDPLFALRRTLINLLTFCYMSESGAKSIFLACIQIPLFLCALGGSYRLWKRGIESQVCILMFLYFFVVHAFIVGWARFSLPVVPAAVILAFGILPPAGSSRPHD